MSEQAGTRALLRAVRENAPRWAEKMPDIPLLVHEVLEQARDGKLQIEWKSKELDEIRREMRQAMVRGYTATIGAAFIISAAVIKGLDGYAPLMIGNAPVLTWLLGGIGALLLIRSWPGGRE